MKNLLLNLQSRVVLAAFCLFGATAGELAIALTQPIKADRYLLQAERELGSGDAAAALETLDRILALQARHGVELPDAFWFRRAEAAERAGGPELALEPLVRYSEQFGQDGEHYVAVLEL